ncbi:MAG: hypothetical protein KJO07_13060 [Deltaproteobacteria bacterium]|jgi:hypothetical protein|nr:hypothetical protein [Deltaproteobacteria bacterium]
MNNLKTLFLACSLTLLVGAPEALANGRGAARGNSASQNRNAQRQRVRTRNVRRQQPRAVRNTANQALNRQQSQQLPSRIKATGIKLSQRDVQHLNSVASSFERMIRSKFTPVVNIHATEGTRASGVQFNVTSNPQAGAKGPTVIEVAGGAGKEVELVMSGGASGHVMQPKYGGRSMSVVEGYGKNDTVYLHHKAPGASAAKEIVKVQSRGLVTQEGFKLKLTKGTHNLFYFRGGPNERSGGVGTEPELRQVTLVVK